MKFTIIIIFEIMIAEVLQIIIDFKIIIIIDFISKNFITKMGYIIIIVKVIIVLIKIANIIEVVFNLYFVKFINVKNYFYFHILYSQVSLLGQLYQQIKDGPLII